jgi:DNA-binding MarR family transcriptional regulator
MPDGRTATRAGKANGLAHRNHCHIQYSTMGSTSKTAQALPELEPGTLEVLQAATRVLAGVALRSVDVLDGAVTLPQLRMLAVLADLGRARSVQVARALGLEASTVTRLADRMVAAGHVTRGTEPGHRGVVTLELTATGQELVNQVVAWREQELARILRQIPPARRIQVTNALRQLVEAAGEGYGLISRSLVPV